VYACAVAKYEVQAGGKSVGHAYVNPDPESKGGSVIEDLYVDPAHRRKGLGRQLLGQVKQNHKGPLRIRPRPHRDMAVGIEDLKNFYAGEGFKHTGDKRDNMVFDKLAFSACIDEIAKLAALEPNEQKIYQEVVRKQQEFDRMASSGKMSDTQQAAHRANTERVKLFLAKKRGTAKAIPGWARDPQGKQPESHARRGVGGPPPGAKYTPNSRAAQFVMSHPYASSAIGGALYGGAVGGLGQLLRSKKTKAQAIEKAKDKGPISRFAARQPAITAAALGAGALPAALYGGRKAGLIGGLAGSYAVPIAAMAADKGLKSLEDRRRAKREEFAKGEKTPKVPKPKAA
jgi:GNAT superfamily N-acetyltransferase